MKKFILPIIALMLMTTACNPKKDTNNAGIQLANLDTTVSPNVDFYQFACGGWMKNNPLTGEYSRFGSFDKLAENNRKQLKGLIVELAAKPAEHGTVAQKIGDIYNLAMDSTKLNADGYKPIEADLKRIAQIKTVADILNLTPELAVSGLDPYFSVYVGADPMNSSLNIVQTY